MSLRGFKIFIRLIIFKKAYYFTEIYNQAL